MRARPTALGLTILIVAAACGGSDIPGTVAPTTAAPAPSTAATTSSAAPASPSPESVVMAADGSVSLTLPEGALPTGTTPDDISVSDITKTVSGDGAPLAVYQLKPDGLRLQEPATLLVDVPEPTSGSLLFAVHVSTDGVEVPPMRLTEEGQLALTVEHFSSIALVSAVQADIESRDGLLAVSTGDRDVFGIGETFAVSFYPEFPDELIVPISPNEYLRVTGLEVTDWDPYGVFYYDASVLDYADAEGDGLSGATLDQVAYNAQADAFFPGTAKSYDGKSYDLFECIKAAPTTVSVSTLLESFRFDYELRLRDGGVQSHGERVRGWATAYGWANLTCAPQVDVAPPTYSEPPDGPESEGSTTEVLFAVDGVDCSASFTLDETGGEAVGTGALSCVKVLKGMGLALGYRCTSGNTTEFFEVFEQNSAELASFGTIDARPDCPVEAQIGVFGQDVEVAGGTVLKILEDGAGRRLVVPIRD